MSKSVRGTLLVFTSAVFFSLAGIFIKLSPWSAMAVTGGRSVFSTMVAGFLMLLRKRGPVINKWTMLGAFGVFATSVLFVLANKLTTAANAIVLHFTMPIFVMVFSTVFLHKRPKKQEIITCVLVLTGIVCFFIDGITAGGGLGNILAILSGMTYSIVFFMGEMPKSDPISSVFFGQMMCAVVGFPFIFGEVDFSLMAIMCVVILGVVQEGLAYVFFSIGIKDTPPVTASLISGAEPILSPIWVALFYPEEKIGVLAFIGAVIVLGSIITHNILKVRQKNVV